MTHPRDAQSGFPAAGYSPSPARRRAAASGGAGRRGFTLIELLVVAAIIILLLSLLIVAMNMATRTGQKTRTATLMSEMRKGLVTFKGDIGYYPPVLGPGGSPVDQLRALFTPPILGSAGYNNVIQQWWSSAAMADYLLGWDNHSHDGWGMVSGAPASRDWDSEMPLFGIRPPGPDGVWNASSVSGTLINRELNFNTEASPFPGDQGKVYGPYIELKDERLMGSALVDQGGNVLMDPDTGNPKVAFPGEAGYDPTRPQIICDYWGTPIRYYRRPYPIGAITQSHRPNTDINRDGVVNAQDRVPTLSDVFLLRPWSIKPGTESDSPVADAAGDTSTSRDLDAAEFALFSAGPDKALKGDRRVDQDRLNEDNMTEVGP